MIRPLALAVVLIAALGVPSAAQAARVAGGNWVWSYQHVEAADAVKFTGARAVVVADQPDDGLPSPRSTARTPSLSTT